MKKKAAAKKTTAGKKVSATGQTRRKAAVAPRKSARSAKAVAKESSSGTKTRAVAASSVDVTHALDALLHTMRIIAQHEDELCTLLHDARRTGKLAAPLRRELHAVLALLPVGDFAADSADVLRLLSARGSLRMP